MPARRVVAVYPGYSDAAAAVDRLTTQGLPRDGTTIVSILVPSIRRAPGVPSRRIVARWAAAAGALFGAVLGAALQSLHITDPLALPVPAALVGALVGAVSGSSIAVLCFAVAALPSEGTIEEPVTLFHEVRVDAPLADRAVRILHSGETPFGAEQ
ncbi:general stress protein [Pseudosporangium ferrugineum]|uniref:Uncharacterized protein n=1 Tax=Pseudosporangium ferrugineum TaxID=439699 RepID=A0A2T0RGA3_9ACTN|nr:general stress protein [Pseudosporangium ferrugineum]PRY20198.1 hypothetical protein CLV70_12579 [Pseudosporangium ferrugineum]